jgi:hypothetical protein
MIVSQPASLVILMALKVSVTVPIWFGLIKTALAIFSWIPFLILSVLVTKHHRR